jgi:hypothetical protein
LELLSNLAQAWGKIGELWIDLLDLFIDPYRILPIPLEGRPFWLLTPAVEAVFVALPFLQSLPAFEGLDPVLTDHQGVFSSRKPLLMHTVVGRHLDLDSAIRCSRHS